MMPLLHLQVYVDLSKALWDKKQELLNKGSAE